MGLGVIQIAKQEIGYTEKQSNNQLDDKTANAGYRNWTKYARDLDQLGVYNFPKNGYDWCDMFVDWCFVQAYGVTSMVKMLHQPLGGLGAGCTYSMGYFKQHKALFDYPKPGDQCFFSNDGWKTSYHTGLVIAVKDGRVYTIEGNTSSGTSIVPNGGCVAQKSYPIGWAKYGRPDYSIVGENQDNIEEDDYMTGEEIYKALNDYLRNMSAPDWAQKELAEAKALGITDGTRPMELIPRYQAAIMAKRAAENMIRKG